jgi:hypothetical protein
MSELGQHCPFLNRTDARCADHFRLEDLPHAFRYCFGRYKACPTYLELRIERRQRLIDQEQLLSNDGMLEDTLAGDDRATNDDRVRNNDRGSHDHRRLNQEPPSESVRPFVQVHIAHRDANRRAKGARVPVASGS